MKTDMYLNLCLEQAANSPLRYHHGAIIVRGGKVIGKGYNDHRSGFDGGALKTGRLPLRSLDSPAIVELKMKHKLKRGLARLQDEMNKTLTPFENMGGGGKLANTPLSMHSEMMAIHSALSASSTLSSSVVSSENPCFRLSGNSKRKSRLQREAIKLYVQSVCEAALAAQSTAGKYRGQSGVQEWRFEGSASRSLDESCVSAQGEERVRGFAHGEQYGETPNEEQEEEEESSQPWRQQQQQQQQRTSQTQRSICA
jgi:deoxycytidylate deaminase